MINGIFNNPTSASINSRWSKFKAYIAKDFEETKTLWAHPAQRIKRPLAAGLIGLVSYGAMAVAPPIIDWNSNRIYANAPVVRHKAPRSKPAVIAASAIAVSDTTISDNYTARFMTDPTMMDVNKKWPDAFGEYSFAKLEGVSDEDNILKGKEDVRSLGFAKDSLKPAAFTSYNPNETIMRAIGTTESPVETGKNKDEGAPAAEEKAKQYDFKASFKAGKDASSLWAPIAQELKKNILPDGYIIPSILATMHTAGNEDLLASGADYLRVLKTADGMAQWDCGRDGLADRLIPGKEYKLTFVTDKMVPVATYRGVINKAGDCAQQTRIPSRSERPSPSALTPVANLEEKVKTTVTDVPPSVIAAPEVVMVVPYNEVKVTGDGNNVDVGGGYHIYDQTIVMGDNAKNPRPALPDGSYTPATTTPVVPAPTTPAASVPAPVPTYVAQPVAIEAPKPTVAPIKAETAKKEIPTILPYELTFKYGIGMDTFKSSTYKKDGTLKSSEHFGFDLDQYGFGVAYTKPSFKVDFGTLISKGTDQGSTTNSGYYGYNPYGQYDDPFALKVSALDVRGAVAGKIDIIEDAVAIGAEIGGEYKDMDYRTDVDGSLTEQTNTYGNLFPFLHFGRDFNERGTQFRIGPEITVQQINTKFQSDGSVPGNNQPYEIENDHETTIVGRAELLHRTMDGKWEFGLGARYGLADTLMSSTDLTLKQEKSPLGNFTLGIGYNFNDNFGVNFGFKHAFGKDEFYKLDPDDQVWKLNKAYDRSGNAWSLSAKAKF